MAKETIGQLAIGIGLDFSALEADLGKADQTLSSALSRIQSNTKAIKLETEIDVTKLESAGTAVDQLRAKERGLTREIEEQNKAVKLLRMNQQYAEQTYGKDNWATRKATNAYLKQVLHVEKLNQRLRETQTTLAQISGEAVKTSTAFGGLGAKLQGGLMGAAKGATALAGGLASAYGSLMTIRQGLSWISEGVDMAANVYDFSRQYGGTFDQMQELLGIFAAAKVEARDVFKGLAKTLDETADPANKTAQALARFGVTLRTVDGETLPTTDALKQLAAGFAKAEAEGRQMEFIQALPRQMRSYVDLLQKYPVYLAEAQKVTRAVIDPEMAATIGDDLRTLDQQMAQFKLAAAGAFLPVALEIIPKATESLGDLIRKMNEAETPLEKLLAVVGKLNPVYGGINSFLDAATMTGMDIGKNGLQGAGLDAFVRIGEDIARRMQGTADAEMGAFKKLEDVKSQQKKSGPVIGDADIKAIEKYESEVSKLGKTLDAEIYKATHNDLENTLHEIELTAEKRKQAIVDAAKAAKREVPQETLDLIDTAAEQRKAKALEDFERSTVSAINGIFETGLRKRLSDIEKEKQAWIKKGIDEVAATRAAERQKQQAVQDAAQAMFTSQRKYLEAFRAAKQQEETGIEVVRGVKSSGGGGVIGALQDLLRQEMGIRAGDRTSIAEINEFNAALEQAKRTLIPLGEAPAGPEVLRGLNTQPAWTERFAASVSNALAPLATGEVRLSADGIETRLDRTNEELKALRESSSEPLAAPQVTVNVTIETAITQDSAAMRKLADTVADHITPVVESAIGQSWNSYTR